VINFASAGSGALSRMDLEQLRNVANVDVVHVPYNGAGPAVTAMLGGETHVMFVTLPSAIAHLQAGKLKALGISTEKRIDALPDVPTMTEVIFPQMTRGSWQGIFAPAGTPRAIVNTLHAAPLATLASPEIARRSTRRPPRQRSLRRRRLGSARFAANHGGVGCSVGFVGELGRQALGELGEIDDDSPMCATADFLGSVHCMDSEFDVTTDDVGDFGERHDAMAYGSRCKMAHVDARAYCALATFEVRFDRVEGRVLHGHDHDWSRQHRRKCRVLEAVGQVLRRHDDGEGTFGPSGYREHEISF
jgi:hypothetical protein